MEEDWMMELRSAVGILLGLLAGLLVGSLLIRTRQSGLPPPPCIRGWIPWLGAALQMRREPLEFIHRSWQKHGPVFTVVCVGNRMTFVSGDEGMSVFFKSKQVNFSQALQKPLQHTASIGEESFNKSHNDIMKMSAFRLSGNRLNAHITQLCSEFSSHLDQLSSQGTMELYNLVRQVMYPAVVDNLFGKGVCPTTRDTINEFLEHFQTFEEGFVYGSQFPEWVFRDWSVSKQWLLKMFKNIVLKEEESKPSEDSAKTILHHLLDTLKGNSPHNFSLLLLWASQANANPITFWTLAFIISEPEVYKKVINEITSVFGKGGQHHLSITATDLKKVPFVKSCFLEALRLRSPGAVFRKVVKPLKVYNYEIPPGDLLLMSPYWVHRDPKYFLDPEKYKPERWTEEMVDNNIFPAGYIAFGGGKYPCPGRWFALMEVHMLVILFLYKYELELLDPLPKMDPMHFVGVQRPAGPLRVKYKLRE
ncbi:24-hydroxycholesterol 7-alpha-hydroxylase-like isoform X1 [Aquarana catesbeiana]|uniref:24-hydroxycholesterol 7-alpha-hydroxylase-like isoform X1 n=1 Tax=Aquarana catesbeiana TaxID=8400 RepID=UPI003CC923A0